MSQPRRETTAGRVYLDLRALARREGRPTDELLVRYVLERFLYRLSISPHRNRMILKGGMLLAALDGRRPTRDVDLLVRGAANDIESILALTRNVLGMQVDDGVIYDVQRMIGRTIREQDLYTGVRIVAPAHVDRARQPLRIDVSVGDPVTPAPVETTYPALLGQPFHIIGYPLATVVAEKVVTMIDRGDATTRERDFVDVIVLCGRHEFDAAELLSALRATAVHRRSQLRPLGEVLISLPVARQRDWSRYIHKSGLFGSVPESYADAIVLVANFMDPLLAGEVSAGRWSPSRCEWET